MAQPMTPENITPTTPLRLAIAAQIAFPDGSMKVSGLRKERDNGRLVVEVIAGKEYTTLAAIEEMRRLCRAPRKAPASTLRKEKVEKPTGSSVTDRNASARAALRARAMQLSRPSADTSQPNTSPSSQVVKLVLSTS
jgi:hypothetical protein